MSLPDEDRSTGLPESKQDASLASTYEARPGAQNISPVGVSTTSSEHPSAAPFVDSTNSNTSNSLSGSVKNSLGTQSATERLPSAQSAADTVKSGASSLMAGISSLALGVNNATAQNAAASHPESEKAQDADDLHIPGAFEDETSDREDIAAVQRGAQTVSEALPSTQAVKESIPSLGSNSNTTSGASESLAEQAQTGARSVQDQVQQGVDYVKEQLPGQQIQPENDKIHKDGTDYIKSQLHDQNINSVGATSTSNELAGQVPLEPREVPQVVQESQREAGGAAPLDDEAVINSVNRDSTTAQLAGQAPLESRGVPTVVSDSQRQAGVSPEAAANPEAVQDKEQLEQELKREVPVANVSSVGATSTTNQLAGQVPFEPRDVPQVVTDSQKEADVSPEASANAEAVREKKEVEQELKREVPEQTGTDNTPTDVGAATSGRLAAAGTAIASAATSARQATQETTGTDPVSVLPVSAQETIDGNANQSDSHTANESGTVPHRVQESQQLAGVSPEASANPEAVQEKEQLEQELKREVPKQGDNSNITSNISDSVTGGLAAAGAAVAGAATYARQKAAETTGTDPVSVLPEPAQNAIDGNAASDNAASDNAASDNAASDNAASGNAASDNAAPSGSAHVPQVVTDSQHAAGFEPEASANPSAVQEKSAVEQELKREISLEAATSDDQGVTGALTEGAAAAGSAAVGAAPSARQNTADVTGTDPVSALPGSAQRSVDQPERHLGEDAAATSTSDVPAANTSYPHVVGEPDTGLTSSLGNVDLRSGVHNGVVGDHLDDPQSSSARSTSPQVAEPASAVPVSHISSVRDLDLSAGVKNTVVGSGAEVHEDSNNAN